MRELPCRRVPSHEAGVGVLVPLLETGRWLRLVKKSAFFPAK